VSGGAARVRPAEARDLEALVGFAAAMAHETEGKALDGPTLRAGVAALLADPGRGRTFVVESGGAVVASLMLTFEWSDWRNGFWWWIQSVYVAPGERRRGHYRRLHGHVRALAAAQPDVCGLRLYVENDNAGAQATYRRMGMHEAPYKVFEESTRGVG
jgi:ribosomal protein S18 acetylase RimI-like enzyme